MSMLLSGGNAAVQALLYGGIHPATQAYFDSQPSAERAPLLAEAKSFFNDTVQRFGFMATEATKRLVRDVRRTADWCFHGDYVRPLRSTVELQMASPIMRRYIMAEPLVRKMYHKQQLSGFDGEYADRLPQLEGEDHPDYQRVMQDHVVVNAQDESFATHWMEDDLEDEAPLSFQEQLDIQEVWAMARDAIVRGKEDPTSLYGAVLE